MLDKAIQYGKEKRKEYRGAKAIDSTCRNHGSCVYCQLGRTHKSKVKLDIMKEKYQEWLEELD